MEIRVIKTEADYNNALKEIDNLMLVEDDSPEAERLELLSILVENYEEKHHKIDSPDPIEAIKFVMEQSSLTNSDLLLSIGSRGRVSEVLNYKRKLTLPMIRRLNKNLNIPADILIQDFNKKKSA